jgi:putative membrane protein
VIKAAILNYLINLVILWGVTEIFPGLSYTGGFPTLATGALGLMGMNIIIIPLLKVVFLPLNILTLGIFTWVLNVIALYLLTTIMPNFKLVPYDFPGGNVLGITLQPMHLTVLWVAIIASFMIGFASRFFHWLTSKH